MKVQHFILASIMILGAMSAYSQDHTVFGSIYSSIDGQPLNGVEVICWESFPPTRSVSTKYGEYSIQVPSPKSALYFISYGGDKFWKLVPDSLNYIVELESQQRPDPVGIDKRMITGKVILVDDNSPLSHASIIVKGTTIGTISNDEGCFELAIPISADELIVSYVGLKTMDIRLAGRDFVNITMETDILGLNPVGVKYIRETGETIGITNVNELPEEKNHIVLFQMFRSWFGS